MSLRPKSTPKLHMLAGKSINGSPNDKQALVYNQSDDMFDYEDNMSNPSTLLQVETQEDLESQFGSDIIIPIGSTWTILITESFTLTKPIKIGEGVSVEIIGAVLGISVTYTGSGAMFQNEIANDFINTLRITNIQLVGDGTNDVLEIRGDVLCKLTDVSMTNFESIGLIRSMFVDIRFVAAFDVNDGILLISPIGLNTESFSHSPFGTPATFTFIVITSVDNPTVSIKNTSVFNSNVQVVFLDPSSGEFSDYTVEGTKGTYSDLFVQGTDRDVFEVLNPSSTISRFHTVGAHGYVVGDRIVHSGFANASYNVTRLVSNVPTGSEYMCGIGFISDDSGSTTKAGLDSTDVRVRALNNKGSADSMFTGDSGLEVFAAPQTVTITAVDTPELIVNANWGFSNLERFLEGVSNQGQLIVEDLETRVYRVNYSATMEKLTGGSTDVGIVLLKNGSLVGFNSPHTSNAGVVQIVGTDLIELTKDDTLDIAVINYGDTNNIEVSQTGLVISLG